MIRHARQESDPSSQARLDGRSRALRAVLALLLGAGLWQPVAAAQTASGQHGPAAQAPAVKPRQAGPVLRRASELPGLLVLDPLGEEVGRVEDVAVDPKNGRLLFVVLSAGAYIRRTDRLSAVPAPRLEVDGDHLVLVDVGRGKLATAHAVNTQRADWPEPNNQAWVELIWRDFGLTPYWPPIVEPTPGAGGEGAGGAAEAGRREGGDDETAAGRLDPRAWRFAWLTELRGVEVHDPEGSLLGVVDELVVDMPERRLDYAVLKPNAALVPADATPPATERRLVVPWGSLLLWGERLLLDYPASRLAEAPFIPPATWPAMTRAVWSAGVGDVYGKRPPPPKP